MNLAKERVDSLYFCNGLMPSKVSFVRFPVEAVGEKVSFLYFFSRERNTFFLQLLQPKQ